MNQTMQKLIISMLCVILFAFAAQGSSGMYQSHIQSIHATLPAVGQFTQEYRIPMKHNEAYKFVFSLPHSYASAYFTTSEDELLTIKSHQVIRNVNEAEEDAVLVFKIATTDANNVGKQEGITIYGAEKPHIDTKTLQAAVVVPLYVCIGLTTVLTMVVMVLLVGCAAKMLLKKKPKYSERQLLLGAPQAFTYGAQPAMFQAQPVPVAFPATYQNNGMRYYTLYSEDKETTSAPSQMYPSVEKNTQAGEEQQI